MFGATYFAQSYFGQGYPSGGVNTPFWVTPLNHATQVSGGLPMVFVIPAANSPPHFQMQIDTVNTFNSVSLLDITSWTNPTGWQYYDGSTWQPLTTDGVPLAYVGNQARYTGLELGNNTYYRRIRARIKT